jgi:hypothetical protein
VAALMDEFGVAALTRPRAAAPRVDQPCPNFLAASPAFSSCARAVLRLRLAADRL